MPEPGQARGAPINQPSCPSAVAPTTATTCPSRTTRTSRSELGRQVAGELDDIRWLDTAELLADDIEDGSNRPASPGREVSAAGRARARRLAGQLGRDVVRGRVDNRERDDRRIAAEPIRARCQVVGVGAAGARHRIALERQPGARPRSRSRAAGRSCSRPGDGRHQAAPGRSAWRSPQASRRTSRRLGPRRRASSVPATGAKRRASAPASRTALGDGTGTVWTRVGRAFQAPTATSAPTSAAASSAAAATSRQARRRVARCGRPRRGPPTRTAAGAGTNAISRIASASRR